ncbi:hypothetical protein [Halorussus caseinilyticus]|uniref:Uncharacterized protein n=1 Tax=Halorussus caseinilyticus TaxID=3034025 RepID=A0ABD5WGT9_9EURY|nr:hypothetical protein [Halorussus sp. DT72]
MPPERSRRRRRVLRTAGTTLSLALAGCSAPRRLAPGETPAETYALLAAPAGDALCPLSGEYRFESHSYFEGDLWGFSAILD